MYLPVHHESAHMMDSPYENIMVRPRLGLTPKYAYVHHMEEWLDILKDEPNFSSYFYRLRDLKWDALDEDYITVGKYKFPVFFHVNPKRPVSEEENFSSMLITTGFPFCPADQAGAILQFYHVERAVPVSWLVPYLSSSKPVYDLAYDHMLTGRIVAMREKIDGYPLVQVKIGSESFLVGRVWIRSVHAVKQGEIDLDMGKVFVIEPVLTSSFSYEGYTYVAHVPESYSYEKCQSFREGVMLFVEYGGAIREYRVKHNPSVELLVTDGQTSLGSVDLPNGVWELTLSLFPYGKGSLVPLRYRPWKHSYAREIAIRQLFSIRPGNLPKLSPPLVLMKEGNEGEWSITSSNTYRYNEWVYSKGYVTSSGLRVGNFLYSHVIDVGKAFLVTGKRMAGPSTKKIPLILVAPDGKVMVSSYPDKCLGTSFSLPWFITRDDISLYLDSLGIAQRSFSAVVYKGNLGLALILDKRVKGVYRDLDYFLVDSQRLSRFASLEKDLGFSFFYTREELSPSELYPSHPFLYLHDNVLSVIHSRFYTWLKKPLSLASLLDVASREHFDPSTVEKAVYLSCLIEIREDGDLRLRGSNN